MENSSEFEGKKEFSGDSEQKSSEVQESLPDGRGTVNIPEKNENDYFSQEFLGAQDLMKISWRMLKARFKKFVLVFLTTLSVLFLVTLLFVFAAIFLKEAVLMFVALCLFILLFIFIALAQNITMIEIAGDKDIKVATAIKKSFSKITPFFKSLIGYEAVAFSISLLLSLPFLLALMVSILAIIDINISAVSTVAGIALSVVFLLCLIVICVSLGVWRSFTLLLSVFEGKSTTENLSRAYGMVKSNIRGILRRTLVFLVLYIIVLLPFAFFMEKSIIAAILYQVANFIMGLWMVMFYYAMYMNLKLSESQPDPADRKIITFFMKTGLVSLILLLISCFLFVILMFRFWSGDIKGLDALESGISSLQTEKDKDSGEGGGWTSPINTESMDATDVYSKDSDNDGLSNSSEEILGTDADQADTDGDGLSDYDELYRWSTDPLKTDTDSDGYDDEDEMQNGYDPASSGNIENNRAQQAGDISSEAL